MTEDPNPAQSPAQSPAPPFDHGSGFGVGELVAAARQLLQPPEFRIEVPDVPEDIALPSRNPSAAVRHPVAENTVEQKKSVGLRKAVAGLATAIWRVQRSLKRAMVTGPADDLRGLERHVNSCFDLFQEHRIELRDHAGQKFVPGMALDVLAFQPMADIARDTIVETIRPSVFYQDELLQKGEVIVAVPDVMEPAAKSETQPETQSETAAEAGGQQATETPGAETELLAELPVADEQTEKTSAETEADRGQNDDRLRN